MEPKTNQNHKYPFFKVETALEYEKILRQLSQNYLTKYIFYFLFWRQQENYTIEKESKTKVGSDPQNLAILKNNLNWENIIATIFEKQEKEG